MACTTTNSIQTYSRATRPPHKRLKACLFLREEVEESARNPKAEKSPGVDNIPSELLKNGGKTTKTVLTVICQKIWEMKEWWKE